MSKFKDYSGNVEEVRGISTVTWVKMSDVCRTEEDYKAALDKEGNKAFVYGIPKLRKNKDMCVYAASNGTTILNLYTFGMLDEDIVYESMKASANGLCPNSYSEQIRDLFNLYDLTPELFTRIVNLCPPGESLREMFFTDLKHNREIKELAKNDKQTALLCVSKDPDLYGFISDTLKNDPDIIDAKAHKNKKEVFYGIDGTQFDSMEDALNYNKSYESVRYLH